MTGHPLIAQAVPLPHPVPPVLAVGAFLKNTICVTRDATAYVSVVHGDLGTPQAIADFETSVDAILDHLGVMPVRVAHDLHPDFHSTRFAQSLDLPQIPVQHHHAHAAAIAAEHGVTGPVLGLSLDGFGLGPGNQSWGGELLACRGADYDRLGHLARLAQPGGDVAAREPWRMAAAFLHRRGLGAQIATRWPDLAASRHLAALLDRGTNCPATSSAGRLFDAACGLLNIHPISQFEGQAPMALEALVRTPRILAGGWILGDDGVLDFSPLLDHLAGMRDASQGADWFHGTLAAGLAQWCAWAADRTGIATVALGGGCFFNKVLVAGLVPALAEKGLTGLCARLVSPGDPGLSLGQAWAAALTKDN